MNPSKSARQIKIDATTSVSDLQKFTQNLNTNAKLRGKINKDGTYILKISTKGPGTGAKELLFGTVKIRRDSARAAISRVAIREGNMKLARLMKDGMNSSIEFTVGDLNRIFSTPEPQLVGLNLPPEQLLDQAYNSLEFRVTKSTKENQPTTWSNFFQETKDLISEISAKSPEVLLEELKEEGHIEENEAGKAKKNVATLDKDDSALLRRIIEAEKLAAPMREAELPETEQNKLAKIWKRTQNGINLLPDKKTPERAQFEEMSRVFAAKMEPQLIQGNVGVEVLGLGVMIDRGINLVLTNFGKIAIQIAEDGEVKEPEELKRLLRNHAAEGNLKGRLEKLEFGAKLLTNDEYLQSLPKKMRAPLGILGVNMANLVDIFKNPNGQYQSLRLVLEDAEKNPQGFIDRVQNGFDLSAAATDENESQSQELEQSSSKIEMAAMEEFKESNLADQQQRMEKEMIRSFIHGAPHPTAIQPPEFQPK